MPNVPHTPAHEALIQSFVAEGWSRGEAEYRAYSHRKAFVPGTSDAELMRRREQDLAYRAECKDGWYPAELAPVQSPQHQSKDAA